MSENISSGKLKLTTDTLAEKGKNNGQDIGISKFYTQF